MNISSTFFMVCLIGIEPTHPAPEAGALSTELQAHNYRTFIFYSKSAFKSNRKWGKSGKKLMKLVENCSEDCEIFL